MENNALLNAARTYGTPAYVFDEDAFARRCALTAGALGEDIALGYCVKANGFLLSCLPETVSYLEVCSPGELALCLRQKADPGKIVFSGLNKTESSINAALSCGAGIFTAESLRQLRLLDEAAQKRGVRVPVLLRLTAGDQFGMDEEELRGAIRDRSAYPGLDFAGLHFFSGTQKAKARKIAGELDDLSRFADGLLRDFGFEAQRLEYGPGLFADYFGPAPGKAEEDLLYAAAPHLREAGRRFHLTVELGRFLAAPCGDYLTAVHDVKTNRTGRYVIVDGGSHQLHYDGQALGLRQVPVEVLSGFAEPSGGEEPVSCTVCGSLCALSDRLAQKIPLPAVRVGDILAFRRAGAYAATEGAALFLSRELPRVVLWSRARGPRLVRDFYDTSALNGPDVSLYASGGGSMIG